MRPFRIALPKIAEQSTHWFRKVDRAERGDFAFVRLEKLATCQDIVVNHVDDLLMSRWNQAGKQNCVSAVLHENERNLVAPAHMEENSQNISPYAAADRCFAWAVDNSGTQDDIGEIHLPAILHDQLILLEFSITIRFTAPDRLILE